MYPSQHLTLHPTLNSAVASIEQKSTKREIVLFLQDYCFFTATSTCVRAIQNGNYASLPGLTSTLVEYYLPIEILTLQGHTHKRKQGIRYKTARAAAAVLAPEPKFHEAYSKVIELPGLMCTDKTGRFSVRSKSGNNCIMGLFDYDANITLGESIPDRKSTILQKTFLVIHNKLRKKGISQKCID